MPHIFLRKLQKMPRKLQNEGGLEGNRGVQAAWLPLTGRCGAKCRVKVRRQYGGLACYFFRSQSRKEKRRLREAPCTPFPLILNTILRIKHLQDATRSCTSFKSLKSCSDKEARHFFRSQSRKAAKKNAACAKHPAGLSPHLEHDFEDETIYRMQHDPVHPLNP
jgi:hypothetical protein